jgi:hypothetical protein
MGKAGIELEANKCTREHAWEVNMSKTLSKYKHDCPANNETRLRY